MALSSFEYHPFSVACSGDISERIIAGDYVCVKRKQMWKIVRCDMRAVLVFLANSNDKEVFGIACCYYGSLIWFIIG